MNLKKLLLLLILFHPLQAKDKLAETLKSYRTLKDPQDCIKTAKKYQGRKYRYGKFDCSKFVQKVMKEAKGKSLPRTTRQQIKIGKKVSLNKAKKGDLIFFGDNKHRVGHVGIIIDPKKKLMIHNSSAKGKVVISKYNTEYYRKKFRGVRRI
jgi:cell wall-associated NlpC family hydrolase